MAERRIINGYIVERGQDGSLVTVGPASQAGQSGITAEQLPRNPDVVAQERRDNARNDRNDADTRNNRAFDDAKKYRDEFRGLPSVAEYNVALGTFNSSMRTQANAQGDQSLITSYAKMLDPTSAVREGEFATTANTQNFIDQIKARFAKELGTGGMLTEGGRKAIREEMRNLVVNRFQTPYLRDRQQYTRFAQIDGIDPYKVVGEDALATFPKGLLESAKAGQSNLGLAGSGATDTAIKIPQEYQQAHYDYLRQNWGKIDAQDYAAFRSNLDQRFGLTPDPEAYAGAVTGFNEMAKLGGTPGQLGTVPAPSREMSGIEQGINNVTASPVGTGLATMGNAAMAGLPARLAGAQDKLEALRDMNPKSAMLGEFVGGATGSLATGGGLAALGATGRGAALGGDLLYNSLYGATQDDNTERGVMTGIVSGLAGNVAGSAVGRAFPGLFARGAQQAADNAVPTIPLLQQQAAAEYAASEAAGQAAGPTQTQDLLDSINGILAREGRITPAGRTIDTDTPITRARTLLQDFAGQTMTPQQAGTTRRVLGEGLMATENGAPARDQRRIAGQMMDQFDQWAQPVMPGVEQARETASRYLQGQQIAQARELADANSQWFTQSGQENALRRSFRDMDRSTIRGTRTFDQPVTDAIENVARGDALSNAARNLGKFAPTGAIPVMSALSAGSLAGSAGGGLTVGGLTAGGVMAAGLAGRALATQRAQRAAEMAQLLAQGGPAYQQALEEVTALSARRGGNFASGLFGAGASNRYRDTTGS